jgi:hypothetical protein
MPRHTSIDKVLKALVESQRDLTAHDLIEIEKHLKYIYTMGYEQGFRNGKLIPKENGSPT